MSNDQFVELKTLIAGTDRQLVKEMDQLRTEVTTQLDSVMPASQGHKIMDSLADIAGQFANHTEDHQLNDNKPARYDRWFQEIADANHIKLSTD